jgi:DEAD/DEAH box helicase domain-containing protein
MESGAVFVCPKCQETEEFLQVRSGKYRRISFTPEADGSVSRRLSAWRSDSEAREDGIYCSNCKIAVVVPHKLLVSLRLDEGPPALADLERVKAESITRKLKDAFPATEISVHWRPRTAKPADYAKLDVNKLGIPKILIDRVADAHGIPLDKYYSHQVKAIESCLKGENVVIQTATSSGKTHCYLIPVFTELLNDPVATALFIFPTKALSYDQVLKVTSIGENFSPDDLVPTKKLYTVRLGMVRIHAGKYDGDTRAPTDKRAIRSKARILITNPDALHFKILPHIRTNAGSFEQFFSNLRYVVLDEIHTYRGAFGANVALLMRRLRMLCHRLGNDDLRFICCSATVPNPENHAETLVGVPFKTITKDGAPAHPKAFLLWNPAPLEDDPTLRREPSTDAIEVLTKVILDKTKPLRTITFIQSLGGVERFDQLLKRAMKRVGLPFTDRTATFSSRSHLEQRLEIQDRLISGEIVHVTATSALELGIDIGDLSCCLILGYPGTISSTLQEAGRVGRRGESVAILTLRNDPFEQYFARAPQVFWEAFEKTEVPKVPLDNRHLRMNQLLCAVWEGKQVGGYSDQDYDYFLGPSMSTILSDLKKHGLKIYKEIRKGQAYWLFGRGAPQKTQIYKNIRVPISVGKFDVIERTRKRKVGECDSHLVPRDLHPDAIWICNGRFYRAVEIRYKESIVYVDYLGTEGDTYTFAMPRNLIALEGEDIASKDFEGFSIHHGEINLTRKVYLYREIKLGAGKTELGDIKTTHTTPIQYITTALRIAFDEEFVNKYLEMAHKAKIPGDFTTALHGLEHAMHSVVPIISDFDPHDVSSDYVSQDANSDGNPALYIFDTFAGGLGLAGHCFDRLRALLKQAKTLLSSCSCHNGCPRCLVTPWCYQRNDDLSKKATLHLIAMMLKGIK